MDIFQHLTDIVRDSWFRAGCPERILVAFSGGADSCALLHALHRFSVENHGTPALFAIHVDHGLRPDSASDANFARKTCEALELPVFVECVNPASSSEDDARCARYDALYRTANLVQADAIALAHHMQDQTETVLLHLMRGTVQGLGGMQECTQHHADRPLLWRPFLQTPKRTLLDAMEQASLPFCEDSSNQTDRYLRNHLRLNVLPAMRSRMPGMDDRIAHTVSVLREESHFLNDLADAFLEKHATPSLPCPFIAASAFEALHPALRRRAMLRFYVKALSGFPVPDFSQLTACASIRKDETVNLPAGCTFRHDGTLLHLVIPDVQPLPLADPVISPFKPGVSNGKTDQSIPKALYPHVCLRHRLAGDYIQPFGMQGVKSLQDYLIDRKIPAPFRDHLPLLCRENEVLWVVGVGASEKLRALPDEQQNLLLHYPVSLPFFSYDYHTKEI